MAKPKLTYQNIQKAANKLGIWQSTVDMFAKAKWVSTPAKPKPLDVFAWEKPKQLWASSPYTFGWMPAPTVATPKQPIMDRTPQTWFSIPDFSDLESMDAKGLRDYLDAIEVRTLQWEKLATDELLKGRRAARMLSELEWQKVNPYTQQIWEFGQDIATQEAEMERRRQAQIEAKRTKLEEEARQAAIAAERQWARQQQAVQSTLSFSWFGRSTFAADQANQIQQTVTDTVNAINRAKDLELAEYQAALEWADAEVIKWMKDQRRQLEQQARQWEIDSVARTDELNRQYWVSFEEKMNNLLQAASQTAKTFEELSEDDKQLITSYATVLLDNEGNIDKNVLDQIPAWLSAYVINEAAKLKWGMPGEAAKTVTVGSGKNARVFQWNPQTQQYDIPVWPGWVGWAGGWMWGWYWTTTSTGNPFVSAVNNLSWTSRATRLAALWVAWWLVWALSPEASSLKADYDYIKNNLTLGNFLDIKKKGWTFGSMTESEWDIVKNSATKLKPWLSDSAWEAELNRISEILGIAAQRAKQKQEPTSDWSDTSSSQNDPLGIR